MPTLDGQCTSLDEHAASIARTGQIRISFIAVFVGGLFRMLQSASSIAGPTERGPRGTQPQRKEPEHTAVLAVCTF